MMVGGRRGRRKVKEYRLFLYEHIGILITYDYNDTPTRVDA